MAWQKTLIGGEGGGYKFRFDENVRGAVLWVAAAAALVGLAFAAMLMLTSPDGWATKMAQSATTGEDVSLISYDVSSAN